MDSLYGGQALCASPGPLGPPPIWWINLSWKQKQFLHLFQFAKSWIECCVTCSTMQKKVEFVCCERCDLARKIEFTFFELFEPVKNWIHLLLAFLLLQRIVWVINYSFWTKDKSDTNNSLSTVIYFVNKKFNNTWLW